MVQGGVSGLVVSTQTWSVYLSYSLFEVVRQTEKEIIKIIQGSWSVQALNTAKKINK